MQPVPEPAPPAAAPILHARDSALGGVAEKTWLLSRRVCDGEGRFEVLPDAHFGLGVALSEGTCAVVAGGPITQRFSAFVGDAQIYWLRFRPGLLPRLADVRPADLIDAPGILLERLPGLDLQELGERLLEAPGPGARLRLLDRLLLPIGGRGLCQDRRCARILRMVDALDGDLKVLDLAREFSLSPRTLQRLLLDQVGLTPKQLILNVRLQRTVARLEALRGGTSLARVASESGYADQSHMIRDLKRRAGRRPGDFDPVAFVQGEAGVPA